jgi:hypothetical protein
LSQKLKLRVILETILRTVDAAVMEGRAEVNYTDDLRKRFLPFCEKHHIRRLEVFGSAARGQGGPGSGVDLLVTLDEAVPISTDALLEMAGEAEELVGVPVDFVLRSSLGKSPNSYCSRPYPRHFRLHLWKLTN